MDAAVRLIEAEDEPRIASIEAAADQLLMERFGPELFTEVTPGKDRVADPGSVLVAGDRALASPTCWRSAAPRTCNS